MPADLGRLREVLERELATGCTDLTIEDGLDELLRVQARGEPFRSPLLRMIAALPDTGYRTLDAEGRRSWARRALATIAQQETPPAGAAAAPAPSAAPTTRAPGARRPASPRTTSSSTTSSSTTSAPAENMPSRAASPAPTGAARKIAPGAAGLDLPLRQAGTGLRPATLDRIERLGIVTVGDALRTYPYRHHDFSRTVPISALQPGAEQTVRGVVDSARELRMGRGGRMRATEVTLSDTSGASLRVVWFNQPYLVKQFRRGMELAVSGNVRAWKGRPILENPEYEALDGDGDGTHTGRMVPVYHLTQGLAQRQLRTLIAGLLDRFAARIPDPRVSPIRCPPACERATTCRASLMRRGRYTTPTATHGWPARAAAWPLMSCWRCSWAW